MGFPGGSLKGEYWKRPIASILVDGAANRANGIDNQINTFGAPSGRFTARRFSYTGNDLTYVLDWLTTDAASYVGNTSPTNNLDDGAFRFTGFIDVASPGTISIGTTSDDGSRIKIGTGAGAIDIINNDGSHGDVTVDANMNFLAAGLYPIEITYFAGDWTSDGGHNGSTNPGDHGGDNFHLRMSGATITDALKGVLHPAAPSQFPFVRQIGGNKVGSVTDNTGGSVTVVGGGNDIWDGRDEFTYNYTEVTGDFDVQVRVESLSPTARWSKAGLMVRETLSDFSRMAFIRVTPPAVATPSGGDGANDTRFAYRTGIEDPDGVDPYFGNDSGGAHEDIAGGNPNPGANFPNGWLRLARIGNTIYSSNSIDGVTWNFVASQDTATWAGGALPATLNLGLAVSRHSGPTLTATAEFRNLKFNYDTPFKVAGASSRGNPNGIRVQFNEARGGGALDPAHYSVDGGVTVSAVSAGPDERSVQLTTSAMTEGTTYNLFVFDVLAADGGALAVDTASFVHGAGYESRTIRVSHNKTGDGGYYQYSDAVSKGIGDPIRMSDGGLFPAVQSNTLFEDPIPDTGANERFSSRVSGILNITTSGNYTFYMSSDDAGYLYLSTDEDPAKKVQIAREPEWSGARQYINGRSCCGGDNTSRGTPPSNISTPIALQAGSKYYLELIFSEGGGGNNGSATWLPPGGPAIVNGSTPIPESAFTASRWYQGDAFFNLGPVTILESPANLNVASPNPATFTVTPDGTPNYTYQWQRKGASQPGYSDIPGATSRTYTQGTTSAADDLAQYRVIVRNEFSEATSLAATLTIGVDVTPPTLVSAVNVAGSDTQFDLVFSEPMNEASVETLANYTISGGVTISNPTLQPDGRTVRFTSTSLSAFTCKTLTVNNVRDASGSANPIAANSQIGVIYSTRNVLLHRFDNISGVAVADLVNNAKFPNSPDFVSRSLSSFNYSPALENYGARLMAFLSPQVTGNYTFYIAADDGASLWLSTDENPANKVLIANEPVWASERTWTGEASGGGRLANPSPSGGPQANISGAIPLQGGCRYYIEMIYKEGGGGDYGAATWRTPPNGPQPNVPISGLNGTQPIPGTYLSAFDLAARLLSEPQDVTTTCGRIVSFTANIIGTPPLTIQWYRDDGSGGVAIPGANGLTLTVGPVTTADNGARFYATADTTEPAGHVETRHALLTVTPDPTPPHVVSVTGSATFDKIHVQFDEILLPTLLGGGAEDPFNYTVSGGLSVTQAVLSVDGLNVELTVDALQTPNTVYDVTVSAVQNFCGSNVPPTTVSFRSFVGGCGGLLFEAYNDIGGTAVSALTGDPDYPNNPNERRRIPSFDTRAEFGTDNYRDNYGARLRGIYIPPSSGRYIFYVHSDDASQLFLNPNGPDPAGKVMIAEELTCCRDWPAVFSAPIQLTGGQAYYIEGLFKEGGGGDYMRVAARVQGSSDPLVALSANQLGAFAPPGSAGDVNITQQPANATVPENTTVTFTAVAANTYNLPTCYQWQRDNGSGFTDIPGANGTSYSFLALPADNGARFRLVASIVGDIAESSGALLTVIADTNPPCLLSASGDHTLSQVILTFSELMDQGSVEDAFNYSIDGGLQVSNAVMRADGKTVVLTTSPQTPGTLYNVTVAGATDRAVIPNPINPTCNRASFRSWTLSCGFLRMDYFGNIGGTAVSALTGDPRFPNSPDATYLLPAFDTRTVFPDNSHENYGARVYGTFVPPTSGNWIFYLASDDASELYLNPTGTDPNGKVKIAEETGCCHGWTGGTWVSAPQALVAGQAYYIEGLYKEGGGGDYLKVAARLDTQPPPEDNPSGQMTVSVNAISSSYLCSFADASGVNLTITDQPDDQTVCINPLVPTPPTATLSIDATALRGSAGTTLACADFNANNGGFTVETPIAYDGPWMWNAGTGTWQQNGQDPENQHANTSLLTSPPLPISVSGRVKLTFVHRYSFESGRWDGGQVRISRNGGAFTAVPNSAFLQAGYNGSVLPNSASLLAGQEAFVENSPNRSAGAYITSIADLGTFSAGDTLRIQFIAASDTNTRGPFVPNWEIDSGCVTEGIGAVLPLFVQWQKLVGATWQDIPNALGLTYSFTPSLADNGSRYRAIAFTLGMSATSAPVTLTVIQANTPPQFTCNSNQVSIAEDSGPQTVPDRATGIKVHSIPRPQVQPFNSTPPNTTAVGINFVPVVTGGSLHLTEPINSIFSSFSFNLPATTHFNTFQASWKSLIGGGAGGGADGYSFNIGQSNPLDDPSDFVSGISEEGAAGPGLSVAIDTFNNTDVEVPDVGIEINWGGTRVAFQEIPKDNDGSGNYLRKNQFVNASLDVSAAGVATFTYDGNTISANLSGYTGLDVTHVVFAGRTGGANDNMWIDDLGGNEWIETFLPPDASTAESTQTVQFLVSNDNPSLFSTQPALSPDGTLTYTPAANACGTANVTVVAKDNGGTACNGNDTSAPCTFVINITCSPDCPVANPTSVTVAAGGQVNFQLPGTDPDGGSLQYAVAQAAAHGTVTVAINTGAASYAPNPGYTGPDSFTYTVSDGQCTSPPGLVSITVGEANRPPVCVARVAPDACILTFPNDANLYAVSLDNAQACVVLDGSGSSDPDGDALTYHWTVDGFNVSMDPSQEPNGGGTGSGSGKVTISGNTLTINISFSGLTANATAAHIHGPAGPGTNAGVLYPLSVPAATAGTISQTVTLVEGTGGFTIAQQLEQLCDGLWYVNIHSAFRPGGEIRGQIQPGTLSGATATACLPLGCHVITLCVSDGRAASFCDLRVCVISAGEAVEQCVTLVDNTDIGRKNKRPLLATLKAAAAAFDRGDITPALNNLEAFQHKVAAQIARDNPAAAEAFIECAQRILEAVGCAAEMAQ